MDSATRSWCNCMLIECASEYGIRMEAVRFDIPFCLHSLPLRPSSTSFSSSGRLLRIRLGYSPPALSFLAELSNESAAPSSTLHENRERSILRLILRASSPSPRPIPRHPCLLRIYRHGVYVIPIIHYKVLLAHAMSHEIACTFVRYLCELMRLFYHDNRNIFREKQ